LREVLVSLLNGRRPRTPVHSVCLDCKRRGSVCIMVAQGVPCLGPVTHAGCGAICPAYDRGCYGCYGPCEQPNLVSLTNQFESAGEANEATVRKLRGSFNGYALEFRAESDRLAGRHAQAKP
jgi:coenzyme F420-reducing hydrogenase gamma subunit